MQHEFEMSGNEEGWIGVFIDTTESEDVSTKTRREAGDGLGSLRIEVAEPFETVFVELIAGQQTRRFRCVSNEDGRVYLKFPEAAATQKAGDTGYDICVGVEYEALFLEAHRVQEVDQNE